LAQGFASWIRASEHFELAAPQILPIVAFRFKANLSQQNLAEAHARIVEEVTRDGRRWISETRVNGQSVLRMMVISYLTAERHLQDLSHALTKAATRLALTGTRNAQVS
jgi:glutamate/tyrosine decarboxylase-like PLP-dependent enzyme